MTLNFDGSCQEDFGWRDEFRPSVSFRWEEILRHSK